MRKMLSLESTLNGLLGKMCNNLLYREKANEGNMFNLIMRSVDWDVGEK